MALDALGNAYMIGLTSSNDLPTVAPFQPKPGGGFYDGFIAKFDGSGQTVYASYLGGSGIDFPFRVAVDPSGNAAVAGFTQSSDFPIMNAIQPKYAGGQWDAFVTKVASDGAKLIYSTYLGGSDDDFGYAIYSDSAGNIWVGGSTSSQDFLTISAFQGFYAGGPFDAFLTKINADPVQAAPQ